jgi:DNA-binding HxlR family transcriptional regulator
MDTEKFSQGACSIARGLCRIGDAWSMMILRDASQGISRFDAFQKSLGIAPNILTRRLAALVEDGMLEKRRYSERPPRDEYVLTEMGRDYLPVLHAMGAWSRKHFGSEGVSQLVDANTGRPIDPVVIDRVSGRPTAEMPLRLVEPAAKAGG